MAMLFTLPSWVLAEQISKQVVVSEGLDLGHLILTQL